MTPRAVLSALYQAAVAAADPLLSLPTVLPQPPPAPGRLYVVGVGKAAARMAQAVEAHVGDEVVNGLVITRYGHGLPTRQIEVCEAGHPLTDAAGVAACHKILNLSRTLRQADEVWVLLSGGGSALLGLPGGQLSLAEWNAVNQALLRSGAGIREINLVRKHLGALNGGRLATYLSPAKVRGFVLSDVPGDDWAMVASGPISAEDSTAAQALALLEQWQVPISAAVAAHLHGQNTPPLHSEQWRPLGIELIGIGSAHQSLQAAAVAARRLGFKPWIISADIEGEAAWVGQSLAMALMRVLREDGPVAPPCVILSGGETSVRVRTAGRGGRNSECLLSAALTLEGLLSESQRTRVFGLFADTDGIDGTQENAGAFMDGTSMTRLRAQGVDPHALLQQHLSYDAFAKLDDLWVTGPTHTNVNDFRAWLVLD
jgi:glycerate 2-kinase